MDWKYWLKRIPNKIQIKRKRFYEVLWADEFAHYGETRFDKSQIVLALGQVPSETVHTYLHEVLHAISAEYDADLTERQVRALEKALYYVLKAGNLFKE